MIEQCKKCTKLDLCLQDNIQTSCLAFEESKEQSKETYTKNMQAEVATLIAYALEMAKYMIDGAGRKRCTRSIFNAAWQTKYAVSRIEELKKGG